MPFGLFVFSSIQFAKAKYAYVVLLAAANRYLCLQQQQKRWLTPSPTRTHLVVVCNLVVEA